MEEQTLQYIYIVLFSIGFFTIIFFPYHKIKLFQETNYNSGTSFEEGYDCAMKAIDEGKHTPQELFNQAKGGEDRWDKGWMEACIQRGAKGDYWYGGDRDEYNWYANEAPEDPDTMDR